MTNLRMKMAAAAVLAAGMLAAAGAPALAGPAEGSDVRYERQLAQMKTSPQMKAGEGGVKSQTIWNAFGDTGTGPAHKGFGGR